jgi:hypothetical protein
MCGKVNSRKMRLSARAQSKGGLARQRESKSGGLHDDVIGHCTRVESTRIFNLLVAEQEWPGLTKRDIWMDYSCIARSKHRPRRRKKKLGWRTAPVGSWATHGQKDGLDHGALVGHIYEVIKHRTEMPVLDGDGEAVEMTVSYPQCCPPQHGRIWRIRLFFSSLP